MDFYCAKCNRLLDENGRDFEPCEKCLEDTYNEGYDAGYAKGHTEGYEEGLEAEVL